MNSLRDRDTIGLLSRLELMLMMTAVDGSTVVLVSLKLKEVNDKAIGMNLIYWSEHRWT